MTPRQLNNLVVEPTLDWLAEFTPIKATPAARAMMLAIAWQESELRNRVQVVRSTSMALVEHGPARSWWQMERISVTEVMGNAKSREFAKSVCEQLGFPATPAAVHMNIAFNDQLACAFARLNLWLDPHRLVAPRRQAEDDSWAIYYHAWRPGKPHRQRWGTAWANAIELCPEGAAA